MQTYTVSDALGIIGSSYPRLISDGQGPILADLAQSMVWNRADWRTSISELPPFFCVPFEQDHGAPNVTVPADFQGLRNAYLSVATTDPAVRKPLKVKNNLETTHVLGIPDLISYEKELKAFRLWPRCGDAIATPYYMIEGTYKRTPVKITPLTVGTALVPIDDRFFEAFLECLRYQFMQASKDPQAGRVEYNKAARAWVATGQMGIAYAKLDEMAQSEAADMGGDSIAPSEPLLPFYQNLW